MKRFAKLKLVRNCFALASVLLVLFFFQNCDNPEHFAETIDSYSDETGGSDLGSLDNPAPLVGPEPQTACTKNCVVPTSKKPVKTFYIHLKHDNKAIPKNNLKLKSIHGKRINDQVRIVRKEVKYNKKRSPIRVCTTIYNTKFDQARKLFKDIRYAKVKTNFSTSKIYQRPDIYTMAINSKKAIYLQIAPTKEALFTEDLALADFKKFLWQNRNDITQKRNCVRPRPLKSIQLVVKTTKKAVLKDDGNDANNPKYFLSKMVYKPNHSKFVLFHKMIGKPTVCVARFKMTAKNNQSIKKKLNSLKVQKTEKDHKLGKHHPSIFKAELTKRNEVKNKTIKAGLGPQSLKQGASYLDRSILYDILKTRNKNPNGKSKRLSYECHSTN